MNVFDEDEDLEMHRPLEPPPKEDGDEEVDAHSDLPGGGRGQGRNRSNTTDEHDR